MALRYFITHQKLSGGGFPGKEKEKKKARHRSGLVLPVCLRALKLDSKLPLFCESDYAGLRFDLLYYILCPFWTAPLVLHPTPPPPPSVSLFKPSFFSPKQGLLQNVRFIFDTTIEDVLLSRDCEIPKQGNGGFFNIFMWPFGGFNAPHSSFSPCCVVSMLCVFFFLRLIYQVTKGKGEKKHQN